MIKMVSDIIVFGSSQPEVSEYPTPADRLVKGAPMQKNQSYYESDDEHFFVGVWEASPGCWKVRYTEHEYFHILEGKSILRDTAGNEMYLTAGMHVTLPPGFEGEWEVIEHTKKAFVSYEP